MKFAFEREGLQSGRIFTSINVDYMAGTYERSTDLLDAPSLIQNIFLLSSVERLTIPLPTQNSSENSTPIFIFFSGPPEGVLDFKTACLEIIDEIALHFDPDGTGAQIVETRDLCPNYSSRAGASEDE